MKTSYTRPDNSVLPPLPPNARMGYGARSISLPHLNNPSKYAQQWVVTGLFPDTSKQVAKALGKVSAAYIDFDLTDTLANIEGMQERAVTFLTNGNITHIFKGGKAIEISTIAEDPKYKSDLIKMMISSCPEDKLHEKVAKEFAPILEKQFIPYIGKPQVITYTGHGAHAYYWVADDEGYTATGADFVDGEVQVNSTEITDYFKALFKLCNSKLGYDAVDPKVKDLGTRCTRELGSVNIKNSAHPKQVVEFMTEYTAPADRLRFANLVALPEEEKVSGFAAKVANASTSGAPKKGRPAAFKPMRVEHDERITVEVNGTQHELTVAELDKRFDEIVSAQGQVDKVRNCRLASFGAGSMNMYAVRPKDGRGVMMITTATKYMVEGDRHWKEDSAGGYLGYYFYDGLAMCLDRDQKGKVKKTTKNIQEIFMCDPRIVDKIRYNARLETVFIHRDLHLDVHGNVSKEMRIAKNTEWFRLRDDHYITFEKLLNSPYNIDNVSDGQMQRCLKAAAMQLSYDPVVDWVENLQWDGVRRLDGDNAWICKMLGMDRGHEKWELYSSYGRAVMLGIMRNIYIGNTYPDVQHVLTLTGGQGVGKSLLASVLGLTEIIGMDYFHDSGIDMGASAHRGDQLQAMLGCFLVELPEAISLSSSTTDESVKAFLTTKKDKGRMAYAREQSERLRATYFVTNSNDHIFLSDHTGNRRYLVIDCFDDINTADDRLDIDHVRAVLPMLYAEAYQRCVKGKGVPTARLKEMRKYEGVVCEEWNLAPHERAWQKIHNEKFTQPDYIVEQLGDILAGELERGVTHVSYTEVKTKLSKRDPSARLSNIKFANAMTRCGWRKANLRGKNRWLPSMTEEVNARPRVQPLEPAPAPAPVELTPVAENLDALRAMANSDAFKSICDEPTFNRISQTITAIDNSSMIQPVQITLLARHINRAIASSK